MFRCVDGTVRKKVATGVEQKELKIGKLTLSMGSARAEVRSLYKEPPF
jgi:hypothetical protein